MLILLLSMVAKRTFFVHYKYEWIQDVWELIEKNKLWNNDNEDPRRSKHLFCQENESESLWDWLYPNSIMAGMCTPWVVWPGVTLWPQHKVTLSSVSTLKVISDVSLLHPSNCHCHTVNIDNHHTHPFLLPFAWQSREICIVQICPDIDTEFSWFWTVRY